MLSPYMVIQMPFSLESFVTPGISAFEWLPFDWLLFYTMELLVIGQVIVCCVALRAAWEVTAIGMESRWCVTFYMDS